MPIEKYSELNLLLELLPLRKRFKKGK